MKITLKSLKIAKFMSQETLCYSANVYVDGIKAGYVENDGHGGCSSLHLDQAFRHMYNTKFMVPCGCGGQSHCILCKGANQYGVGLDDYCDHIAYDMEKERDIKSYANKLRKQGFTTLVVTKGSFIGLRTSTEDATRQLMASQYPNHEIERIILLY